MRALHAVRAVRGLGAAVVALDVEPKTTNRALFRCLGLQVAIEPPIDTSPSERGQHVDALDPPEIAVSPVAPFPRHHRCGDDMRQEHLAFRLERHCAVEGDEHRRIARYSAADLRAHALS
jgi:hypothetical protein